MNFFFHVFTFAFMLFPIYSRSHPITSLGSKNLGPCICRAALRPNILFICRSIPAHLRTKSLRGIAKLREMAYNITARKGASHILICKEGQQVDAAGRSIGFLFGTSHKARILRAACFRFFSVKHEKGAQRLFFCARGKTAYGPVPF